MCWGAGILLSSGVVRAVAGIEGEMGWKLPFILQWVWPAPLFLVAYFAPESPWNSVRRGKIDEARMNLARLVKDSPDTQREVEATLAYIRHTTAMEEAETENATFLDFFRGTNLRRTEIVSISSPTAPLTLTLTRDRTASSGPPKSSAATPSSATRSSSSKPPASARPSPSTLTSPSRHATSSAASSAGSSSRTSAAPQST